MTNPSTERRMRRSNSPHIALSLQLDACCAEGGVAAMVLADGDGLALASAGDDYACEEVAGRLVIVARRIREFAGTVIGPGPGARWDVQMTKLDVGDDELVLCAVGGTAESRRRQLARTAGAVQRILAA